MNTVTSVNGMGYVYDPQKWISYYDKKPHCNSFPLQTPDSVGLTEKVKQISVQHPTVDLEDLPSNTVDIKKADMDNDIELVSPVQGAVQQARAEYERAPPIKRRRRAKTQHKRRKRGTRCRKRKPKKGRKRKNKKAKRLKKKKQGKQRKRKQQGRRKKRKNKKKKRDIFND